MAIMDEAQALFDAMRRAYLAGDAAACARFFTEDAALYSPYAPPAHGRAEVEALHRVWLAVPPAAKILTVIRAGAAGDLGWCVNTYSEGAEAGNGSAVSILARRPEGGWRIRICTLTDDVPPLAGG